MVDSPGQARLQDRPEDLDHALAVVDVQPNGPLVRTAVREGASPLAVVEDGLLGNLVHVDGWLPRLYNGTGVLLQLYSTSLRVIRVIRAKRGNIKRVWAVVGTSVRVPACVCFVYLRLRVEICKGGWGLAQTRVE